MLDWFSKKPRGIGALILFSIGIFSIGIQKQLTTCDYWWHLKAGEWMLDHQSIPFRDVFSWYGERHQLYWMSHEWLSDVFLAGWQRLFNSFSAYFSGYLWTCFLLFLLFGLLSYINQKLYLKNSYLTMFWLFTGSLVFIIAATPRPHLMSYLLLTLTLWSLERFRWRKSFKSLCFLPLWSFLWANFHGGSSNLPYLLGLLYFISGLFSFEWRGLVSKKWTSSERKQLLLMSLMAFLVIAINPHGFKLWAYPYENMGDGYMLSIIQEWQPPLLRLSGDLLFLLFFVFVFIVLLFKKAPLPLIDFLLIGGFSYLTLGSIRFLPLLYIISSFVLFPHMIEFFNSKRTLPLEVSRPGFQLVYGLTGAIFLILWIVQLPYQATLNFPVYLTDEMIHTLQTIQPQKLYNHYNFGSELIYHDIPVFVDGRADLYSKTILKDAVDLAFLNESPQEIMDEYEFDYFLISEELPLNHYLSIHPQLSLVFEDEGVLLYRWNRSQKSTPGSPRIDPWGGMA